MLRTVLLPLDRSVLAECVLPHAVAVASALHARIILLHVLEPQASTEPQQVVDPLEWRVMRAEAERYMGDVQSRLEAAGVAAEVQLVDGRAADQIVKFAHENEIELVIMSSHGLSGLSGWNLSSVVQKVVARVYTSVMIVRAYRPAPAGLRDVRYARLLAPLDGSQRSEVALPILSDLARAHSGQVLLAHVVRQPEMPGRTPPRADDTDLIAQFVERNRAEGLQYLEELRERLSSLEVETRLLVAHQVEGALHALAEQEDVDLVLLTAHGFGGEPGWPYGSVVISFLSYGFAPVIIVQDFPREQFRPTHAELALPQMGRR